MVVRFVCVVCVPLCVRVFRVSRVCPGSPRCLFTGYGMKCSMELRHVFCVTFGVAVGGIGGMPGR
jgi:hypothetical protein